jgi:hypothetical protein
MFNYSGHFFVYSYKIKVTSSYFRRIHIKIFYFVHGGVTSQGIYLRNIPVQTIHWKYSSFRAVSGFLPGFGAGPTQ